MLIDKLTVSEKRADRFALLFDNGTEIKVSAGQIAEFGLYSGRELTNDEYAALREGMDRSISKTRAMRILGTRNLSAREVERRLIVKGESTETARETVEWLEKTGLIDDEEYAAGIVSYYSGKGYGAARIRNELFTRGIPRGMWENAFNKLKKPEEAVTHYLDKKLKGSADKDDIRKAVNSLCSRGFSYEEAKDLVRKYVENKEEIEDRD